MSPISFIPSDSNSQPKVEIPPELVGKSWMLLTTDEDRWTLADKVVDMTDPRLTACFIANLFAASTVLPACLCVVGSWLFLLMPVLSVLAHGDNTPPFWASLALLALWFLTSYLVMKSTYEFYRHHYVRRNLAKLRKRGLVRRLVGLVFREGTSMQFDGLDDSYRAVVNRILLALFADLSCAGMGAVLMCVTKH